MANRNLINSIATDLTSIDWTLSGGTKGENDKETSITVHGEYPLLPVTSLLRMHFRNNVVPFNPLYPVSVFLFFLISHSVFIVL